MSELYVVGGFAGIGMCIVARYAPWWLALAINYFIWFSTASLVGAWNG